MTGAADLARLWLEIGDRCSSGLLARHAGESGRAGHERGEPDQAYDGPQTVASTEVAHRIRC